jgi:UDP-N-acetylmuramate--alanine ligase
MLNLREKQAGDKYCFNSIPYDIGNIHFIGIGGIGMSGIAEILHNLGYKVTGSDLNENSNVLRLRQMGVKIFKGHNPENIEGAFVVVKSTAVKLDNPEILQARKNEIPVVRRSEMLAELTKLKSTVAVSGSHGKTTTTSMISHIFDYCGLAPTVINGGIINIYGSNAKLGEGDWLVAEADESDGTFIKIPATIGVVTNIDPEHMDYWKDFDDLRKAFREFLSNLPFYGFAVLNDDHDEVVRLSKDITDRKIYTYSTDKDSGSDVVLLDKEELSESTKFTIKINKSLTPDLKAENFEIPSIGHHNISNALAAITVAVGAGIELGKIKEAISKFSGVKRRFTIMGKFCGATLVDDYAHHPVEIKATLNAAKQYVKGKQRRIIAVMQPHRYTRLNDLFNDFVNSFGDADEVIITEMYTAGEKEIEGVNQYSLAEKLNETGKKAIPLKDDKDLPETLRKVVKEDDLIICMGAGSITNYASELVGL